MRNTVYKSFVVAPQFVLTKDGEVLDSNNVLSELRNDVQEISDYARYVVRNDDELLNDLDNYPSKNQPAEIGRRLGYKLPRELTCKGSGESRREKLFQYNVITEASSWLERTKVASGAGSKYISQGWKRTANPHPPQYGDKPYINLGATDKTYCKIANNPFAEGTIELDIVVNRQWRKFIFNFNAKRFSGAQRISNPMIYLDNKGNPKFSFAVEYPAQYADFSSEYIIGVDVGVTNYATVSVVSQKTRDVVYSSTLSQRVHSLCNSIKASTRQVKSLQKKNRPYEAALHRRKNVKKKRELAILAAQEIAELSYIYDNAIVAIEDLSWIKNTMQNGRWNRGELMKWLNHYQSLNGGFVMTVSAYNTSQLCHVCNSKGTFRNWHTFICETHGEMDRDENASANIALKPIDKGSVRRATVTRSKNKKRVKKAINRVPKSQSTLKYPGRDRTKTGATPKRTKKNNTAKVVNIDNSPVASNNTRVATDGNLYGIVGTEQAAEKFYNLYYKYKFR